MIKYFGFGLLVATFLSACTAETPSNPPPESVPPTEIMIEPVTPETPAPQISPEYSNIPDPVPQSEFMEPLSYEPFEKLTLAPAMHERFKENLPGVAGVFVIDAEFIPLGWSSNGRYFAYVLEPGDEACGCYLYKVNIQDLVTDKILWTKSQEGASGDDWSYTWKEHQSVFETAFLEYGIDTKVSGTFFPGRTTRDISFSVDKTMKVMPDYSNIAGIGAYTIKAQSTSLGGKTLHSRELNFPYMYDVDVMGYIQGPDKDRVAMIVGQVWRGWEGPPNTTRFEIVGAHLETGFK